VQWKRWLGFGTALSIVVLLVVYGFRPEPVLVEITEVKRGPLQLTVEEEGKTRVKDRYVVSAAVAGFARRVKLEVGDRVTQGQLLLSLEPLRPNVLDPRSRAEAAARVAAAEACFWTVTGRKGHYPSRQLHQGWHAGEGEGVAATHD
jgi:HlyD family secretion protein